MNQTRLLERMHAVLDGEATADESRELERFLAADPAARARFDELRLLFDGLGSIPRAFPPEGLVASVLAAVPQRSSPRDNDDDQPFTHSRVIGETSKQSRASRPGRSARVEPVFQSRSYFRGENMSGQNSRFPARRKMWIGGGIAAAAVVMLVSFGTEIPPGTSDTTGTIVPAQRYRATQNMADGVTGAPATAQSQQAIPAAQNALAGQAAANAVNNATANATANAVDNATARAVENASARAVDNASARAVNNATARAVENASARAVDNASARAVDNATARAVENASARAVDNATARAVNNATARAVDNASARAVDNATPRAVENASARAVDNATAKAVNNATAKAVDNATANAVSNATLR